MEDTKVQAVPDVYESGDELESREYALMDGEHAWDAADQIFSDAENNIKVAAKIRDKIDMKTPPFSVSARKQEGKAHKSNVPFGILKSSLEKVSPVFYELLLNARFLINNYLPDYDPIADRKIDNAYMKSEHAMMVFTKTLRNWKGFYKFAVGLATEYVQAGHCFAGYKNEEEWRPDLWRLDHAQVPRGTKIMEPPVMFAIKEDYLVHELFKAVRDKATAKEQGWKIKEVVKAINEALPKQFPDNTDAQEYLEYQDLQRDLTPAWSYMKGARQIETYIVLSLEYDGTVSQLIVHRTTKKVLFERRDRYPEMDMMCIPFAFEYGNGNIHGAQCPGQVLWDLTTQADKAANSVVDNLRNRSKIVRQFSSASELKKAKTVVQDDTIDLVGGTAVGNQATIPDTSAAWGSIYDFLRSVIGEHIGAFLPPDIQSKQQSGEKATATQVAVAAQRQDEYRRAKLEWFLRQWALLTHQIKKRLFDPLSADEEAVNARKWALTKMDEQELDMWVNQLPMSSIAKFTELEDQKIAAYLSAMVGNPKYNQHTIEEVRTTATIGSEWVDRVIIPEEDQSVIAEAVRMQQMELLMIEKGQMVPVVPRDNDPVHINVLRGSPEKNFQDGALIPMLLNGDEQVAQAAFDHYAAHVEQAKNKGILGEQENLEKQFSKLFKDLYSKKFSVDTQQQPMQAVG